MQHQLRIYTIRPGTIDDFARNWRAHVVPVRKKLGFQVVGAWINRESSEFVWIVAYTGDDGFEAGQRAYYAAPERQAIEWDPLPYIEKMELRMLDPIEA